MTDRDLADKYIEIQKRLENKNLETAIRENLEFYLTYISNMILDRFVRKHASEKVEAK